MNQYKSIITCFVGVVILIGLYHATMYNIYGKNFTEYDLLNRIALHVPSLKSGIKILPFDPDPPECCSGWPVTHFILFMVLAYKFPQHAKFLFIAGIVWEVMESLIGYLFTKDIAEKNNIQPKSMYKTQWWTGNFNDILFNTAGIIAGLCLKKYYK